MPNCGQDLEFTVVVKNRNGRSVVMDAKDSVHDKIGKTLKCELEAFGTVKPSDRRRDAGARGGGMPCEQVEQLTRCREEEAVYLRVLGELPKR